ncbi:unnamed protein product, partial [Polarella glacialis]
VYSGKELPKCIPEDGCCCCLVFYGNKAEYLLLALVLARRLALFGGGEHPLLVLPTPDVPYSFLDAFERAGCVVLPAQEYLRMHPRLLASPEGRHRLVLTKLRALGLQLPGLKKVLLIDADLLPTALLDLRKVFAMEPPAALLMPAFLRGEDSSKGVRQLAPGEDVPDQWLTVDPATGQAARFNAGVCLLKPDPELLEYILRETSHDRADLGPPPSCK